MPLQFVHLVAEHVRGGLVRFDYASLHIDDPESVDGRLQRSGILEFVPQALGDVFGDFDDADNFPLFVPKWTSTNVPGPAVVVFDDLAFGLTRLKGFRDGALGADAVAVSPELVAEAPNHLLSR